MAEEMIGTGEETKQDGRSVDGLDTGQVVNLLAEKLGDQGFQALMEVVQKLAEIRTEQLRGSVIVVASLKGGVGKSSLVAWLATAIANMGISVGVIDLDIYSPDLATLWGFSPSNRPAHDIGEWARLARAGEKLDAKAVREWTVNVPPGLQLLPASWDFESAVVVDEDVVRFVIGTFAKAFQVTLVDLGPSPQEAIMPTAISMADRVIWVTVPELTAVSHLIRANRLISAAGVPLTKVVCVVNVVQKQPAIDVEEIRKESPFRVAAQIPADANVPKMQGYVPPVGPKPVQAAVEALARELVESLGVVSEEDKQKEEKSSHGLWPFGRKK